MDTEKEAVSHAESGEKEDSTILSAADDTPVSTEQDAEGAIAAEEQKSSPTPPLDWDNDEDPDNPFNWPEWKRAYNTVVPGLLGLAV